MGYDLKGEVLNLGGDPEKGKGTSIEGDLHRKWMDLKAALVNNNEEFIIEECRKNEMKVRGDYNEALAFKDLPPTTRTLLDNHMAKIEEALYHLMELKAEYEQTE